jgi:hypothetical protein
VSYLALKDIDKEYTWFRPMMVATARRLLSEVAWGVKLRVAMGAGLSMLDMVTDAFVIQL